MRELLNEDMYLISEIIDKINFELPERNKMVDGKKVEMTVEEYGQKILAIITKKLYLAKEPANRLLANLLEKDIAEVEKMKLKETIKAFAELLGKEGFADFFK